MSNKLSRRTFLQIAAGMGTAIMTSHPGIPIVVGQDSQNDVPVGAEGTLTVMQRSEYFEQVEIDLRNTISEFATELGVSLDISTMSGALYGDFIAKMQAAVAAGNPPDLAFIPNFLSVTQMHLLDLLEDVTDVVDQVERLYGPTMPGTSPHKAAQFDGVWKAVPFLATSGALFVRGDALAEADIDLNNLDTYDQYRDAALAISSDEFWGWGITPNQSGDGYGFLTGLINSFGGSYTDESGLVVTFDSPETLAAVEWLTELYTSETYAPALPPGILSWTDISNNEAYLAGTIGLTINAFSVYAQAKQEENPVFPHTLVRRQPVGPSDLRPERANSDWFIIFKGAQNIDIAKELVQYLIAPENFLPLAKIGGGLFLPAYENLWTDDLLAIDPNLAVIKEIVSNPDPYVGDSWPAEPNAAIDALRANSVPEQMMANITSGRMTPEEAVAEAHQQIVDIFEQGGIMQP